MYHMPESSEAQWNCIMNVQSCIRTCYFYFLAIWIFCVQPGNTLKCYECTESFTDVDVWVPLDCQVNATAVPVRVCNDQQPFCYVSTAKVKGIVTEITRDCIDECYYGCVASEFGITVITCTSCCDEDFCNTGNNASNSDIKWTHLFSVAVLSFLAQIYDLI